MRSSHSEGRQIDFSPGENYIVVTCGKRGEQYAAVQKVIDMKTGIAKKSFEGIARICMGMLTPTVVWPVIRWCGGNEDKYFARIGKHNTVSIYETETFSLISDDALVFENVRNFSWSPTEMILAVFEVPISSSNEPAWVKLVHVPRCW